MTAESETYWQSASEDTTMQDEHAFIWEAMLDTIDVDLFYGHKMMLGLAKRA